MKTKKTHISTLIFFILFLSSQLLKAEPGIFAYVTNMHDDTVSVIDVKLPPNNNAIIGTIKVGTSPRGVAVSPNGERVYIANTDPPHSISVIDTAREPNNNAVIGFIKLTSGQPGGIAVSPDGKRVYVGHDTFDIVSVIDTSRPLNENAVIGTIPVVKPNGIAVSPDGKRVYVSNNQSTTISVIDTNKPISKDAIIGTIQVGSWPLGISISPDGERIYVANWFSDSVSVINPRLPLDNAVIETVSVGSHPAGVSTSSDGKRVYVTNWLSHTVSVIDTENNIVTMTINVGFHPFGISISPDGKKVYVSNSDNISVIDITQPPNTAVIGTIQVGKRPEAFGNFIANVKKYLWFSNLRNNDGEFRDTVKRGKPYNYKVKARGSHPEIIYQVSGLPNGLVFENDTITGIPKENGIFNIILKATDSTDYSIEDRLILFISKFDSPLINSSLEASGSVGIPFEYKITAKGDSDYPDQPLAYNAGSLPYGLKIDRETGVISGSPETAGVFKVQLIVSNGETQTYKDLILSIVPSEGSGCYLNKADSSLNKNDMIVFFIFIGVYSLMRMREKKLLF